MLEVGGLGRYLGNAVAKHYKSVVCFVLHDRVRRSHSRSALKAGAYLDAGHVCGVRVVVVIAVMIAVVVGRMRSTVGEPAGDLVRGIPSDDLN